jgi:hypothetical protein
MAQQPLVFQDLLIILALRLYSDTPHMVGLLWMSDKAWCHNLYLTSHNSHKRRISMPPAGFEPTTLAIDRRQTDALNRPDCSCR